MKMSLCSSKEGISLLHVRMCSIFGCPDFSQKAGGSSSELIQAPLCLNLYWGKSYRPGSFCPIFLTDWVALCGSHTVKS